MYPEDRTCPDAPHRVPARPPRSAMAIAGMVVGIVALLTSFVPIVNNASFVLALLGLVFAIVGLVAGVRGTRSGKGFAVAGIAVSAVAVIVVLVTQALYGAALDQASRELDEIANGPAVTGVSSDGDREESGADTVAGGGDAADGAAQTAAQDLAVGSSVQLASGLTVSVDEVQPGLVNYDGSTVTGVRVTYVNGGSSEASFNVYDWKGQDAQGAQQYTTYYVDASDELSSGTLAPGGTVTGTVYFDGDLSKVLYYASMLSSSPAAGWSVA